MDESDHLTLVNAGDEEVVSQEEGSLSLSYIYVYYCRTYEKAVSGGGEREKGGHVLRDTTSRALYVRVWPPHTSERRGGG